MELAATNSENNIYVSDLITFAALEYITVPPNLSVLLFYLISFLSLVVSSRRGLEHRECLLDTRGSPLLRVSQASAMLTRPASPVFFS